jgi:hypothetical protein
VATPSLVPCAPRSPTETTRAGGAVEPGGQLGEVLLVQPPQPGGDGADRADDAEGDQHGQQRGEHERDRADTIIRRVAAAAAASFSSPVDRARHLLLGGGDEVRGGRVAARGQRHHVLEEQLLGLGAVAGAIGLDDLVAQPVRPVVDTGVMVKIHCSDESALILASS